MKTRIYLSIILLLCVAYGQAQAETTLVFSTIGESLHIPISEQVLQEAYQQLGIHIAVKEYPAARAIKMANKGVAVDGELHRRASANVKYSNLIKIPVPIGIAEEVAVTKGVSFPINNLESVRPYVVGVMRGLKTARLLEEMNVQKLTSVTTYKQLLLMLDKNRIEVAIVSRLAALNFIKELQLTGLTILEPPIMQTTKIYHFPHKKHEHLVDKLTTVLQEMEASGRIQDIQRQYEASLSHQK